VNNVDEMVKAIEREPDDLTAVCALTDALIEEREMTVSEARRHAEQVVETARSARDLANATALLCKGSPMREVLLAWIVGTGDADTDDMTSVITVVGGAPPLVVAPHPDQSANVIAREFVMVGATWILKQVRTVRHLREAHARLNKPARKR